MFRCDKVMHGFHKHAVFYLIRKSKAAYFVSAVLSF